uniref:Uncharacterized protein n=1 Tax=Parascaris univalens TaxID=6257 RepID=A0A915CIQ9_PARUN
VCNAKSAFEKRFYSSDVSLISSPYLSSSTLAVCYHFSCRHIKVYLIRAEYSSLADSLKLADEASLWLSLNHLMVVGMRQICPTNRKIRFPSQKHLFRQNLTTKKHFLHAQINHQRNVTGMRRFTDDIHNTEQSHQPHQQLITTSLCIEKPHTKDTRRGLYDLFPSTAESDPYSGNHINPIVVMNTTSRTTLYQRKDRMR